MRRLNNVNMIEALERRALFAGVTLVTHGYGGSVTDWVKTMADAIASQVGPLASQPRYVIKVTDVGHDGGPLTLQSTRLGPARANWGSGEILVLLDWSDVAGSGLGGYTRTTGAVGAAVATELLSNAT